jgi:hypothetical protein
VICWDLNDDDQRRAVKTIRQATAAAAIVIAALMLRAAASAAQTEVEAATLTGPAGSAGATVDAISCRTSDDCLAAGDARRARHTVIVRPLLEHWDGDHWASLPFPSPARSAAVAAVACPSLGDCLAVTDAQGAGTELSFIAAVP